MAEKVPARTSQDHRQGGGEYHQTGGAQADEANRNVPRKAGTAAVGVLVASGQKVPSKRHDRSDDGNDMEVDAQEKSAGSLDTALVEEGPLPPFPSQPLFGHLYEPLLKQHRRRYQDGYTIVPYPLKTIGSVHDQERSLPECRCVTNCLTLYCPCFASVAHCSILRCGCTGCRNDGHRNHAQERRYATHYATVHHPQSFRIGRRKSSLPPSSTGGGGGGAAAASSSSFRNSSDSPTLKIPKKAHAASKVAATEKPAPSVGTAGATTTTTTKTTTTRTGGAGTAHSSDPTEPLTCYLEDGTVVRGLAFARISKAPARLKPPPPGSKPPPPGSHSQAAATAPAPAFVVHDLMLTPSTVPTAAAARPAPEPAPEPTLPPFSRPTGAGAAHPLPPTSFQGRGTEVERHWQRETLELRGFLSRMHAEAERKRAQLPQRDPHHPGADPFTAGAAAAAAEPPGTTSPATTATVDAQASMVLASVLQDMVAVDRVARAAELFMMTRLGKRRLPRGHYARGEAAHSTESPVAVSGKAAAAATDPLLCSETLPDEIQTVEVPDHDEMRKALIGAARDAAIFRETARILRRKARELCDRRIKDNLNKLIVENSTVPQPPPASRQPSR